MANVACRYILDQPAVGGIIVGARLGISEHCEDNLQLFRFALAEADHAEIDEAVARLHKIPGDCGDEYRRPPYLTAAGDLSDHLESLPPPYEVRTGDDGRTRVLSGTIWEEMASFSRALRRGDRILISGTTATHGDRIIGGDDPAAQTHFVIDKIEGALAKRIITLSLRWLAIVDVGSSREDGKPTAFRATERGWALLTGKVELGPGIARSSPTALAIVDDDFIVTIPLMIASFAGGYLYALNPSYPWFLTAVTTAISIILVVLFIRDPQRAEV